MLEKNTKASYKVDFEQLPNHHIGHAWLLYVYYL